MHRPLNPGLVLALAATLFISCFAVPSPAQDLVRDNLTEPLPLVAHSRVFPGVGPGVEELRRDATGNYLVLAQPGKSIGVYAADGRPLGDVPSGKSQRPALISAADFDTGAEGRLYVCDRGAKAVKIFDARGTLLRAIPVGAPVSIAALPNGEFGVTNLESRHLLEIYSLDGKVLREAGDFFEVAEHERLNRFLNLGRLAADATGHIYFAFSYFPEPTLRKYDRDGHTAYDVSLNTLEFEPEAQAVRRLIQVQDRGDSEPSFKPIVNAVGVDSRSERVWMAMGDLLVEFDADGSRIATYRTYTAEGEGLQPVAILVEPDRLLLAADPAGIYEFARPDVKPVKVPVQPISKGPVSNQGASQSVNPPTTGPQRAVPASP